MPFNKLINEYLSLFDMIERGGYSLTSTSSDYIWKPLIADPIYLNQQNEIKNDKTIQIIDHKFNSYQC